MLTLGQSAAGIGATTQGPDGEFQAVTSDSRAVNRGDLFVALAGGRFDGHEFVAQAITAGAAGAMVSREAAQKFATAWSGLPLIVVEDTRIALGKLAELWRRKFSTRLVAVTGSNGKTTVKEMLAAILRAATGDDAVLATSGNLNNDIGMPLTLLKLRPQHKFAVIEMGMNHPGEIAYLSALAHPDVALINNAGAAHLAGLGSVAQVARAKGEIFQGLAADGVAILNADDAYAPLWRDLVGSQKVIDFGLEHPADVTARCTLHPVGSELRLSTPKDEFAVELHVPGLHNVRNALAATAAAFALGVDVRSIADGLNAFHGVKGRLQRKRGLHGAVLIDDTYNANPASVHAALAVLAGTPGKKILVLGDMGELGPTASQMHRDLGIAAREAGVDILFALGDISRETAQAFGANAWFFERIQELLADLENQLGPDVTVLVKGSRFMQMERVIRSFEVEN